MFVRRLLVILLLGAVLAAGGALFVGGRVNATRAATTEPARAEAPVPVAPSTTEEPQVAPPEPEPIPEPEPEPAPEPEPEPAPVPAPEPAPVVEPAPEAPAAPVGATMGPGDSGEAVLALQQRLLDLGFWLPVADGQYGSGTSQAVLAFQKAHGLDRDGIAGPATQAALQTGVRPGPQGAEPGTSIEIDLARQLLLVVQDGQVTWALNTSTGTASTPTRVGRFHVDREIDGIRDAPLGRLYRPKYFDRGIAMHGSSSIPGYPASHGCTRLSNDAMDMLWSSGLAPIGTPVWVY
jgi:lipoprotein-anchoring transpeptidase ErfK/SrfK